LDTQASEYTKKHCKRCELDSGCACQKRECVCGGGCGFKGNDAICPRQTLKWAAIQCVCSASEYYRALLNVTVQGDKQHFISWGGCEDGVLAEGGGPL